jgi:hypothetical protein
VDNNITPTVGFLGCEVSWGLAIAAIVLAYCKR